MTRQTRFCLALVVACSAMITQPAAAQERFGEPQGNQAWNVFQPRNGGLASDPVPAVSPLRFCGEAGESGLPETPPIPVPDARSNPPPAALPPLDGGQYAAGPTFAGVIGAALFGGAELTAFQSPNSDLLSDPAPAVSPLRFCAEAGGSGLSEAPPIPVSDARSNPPPAALPPLAGGWDGAGPTFAGVVGAGLFGGAEMTILRPFVGNVREVGLSVPARNVNLLASLPANQFGIAPRFWLGYSDGQGTGVRVRYWQFDQDLAAESSNTLLDGSLPLPAGSHVTSDGRLNVYTVNAEVLQHVERRLFYGDVGFGIRVAGMDHDRNFALVVPGQLDTMAGDSTSFTGIGPTLSAEIRRELGDGGLTMLITTRGAMLLGEHRMGYFLNRDLSLAGATLPAVAVQADTDAGIFTGEVRMGVEWGRVLQNGRKLYVRALWETQFWAGPGTGLSGMGMMGGTLGLGISR